MPQPMLRWFLEARWILPSFGKEGGRRPPVPPEPAKPRASCFCHRSGRARYAFSILEMLIVLTTMAILAGVALTHFQESALDAKRSVLIHNWHIYQAQIQLYQLTHLGQYPELRNGQLPQLFHSTNQYGQIGPPGPQYPYGPYFDAPPINPYTMTATVVYVENPGQKPRRPIGNAAWQYDPVTGDIWPNHREFFQQGGSK